MTKKSLSDFASEYKASSLNNNINSQEYSQNSSLNENFNNNFNSGGNQNNAQASAEEIINKYSAYSKSELEDEIKQRVSALKQSGQFDKQKLLGSYQMIEGFLSPEQKAQMLNMIEALDEKN